MHRLIRFAAPLACAASLLGACALLAACNQQDQTPRKRFPKAAAPQNATQKAQLAPDRPYYRGTAAMRQDIRDLFARVPGSAPHQWAQISRKLVAYGEPAVPQMVANLGSHEAMVPVMAAYTLGMIQDPRALDALYEATSSSNEQLRYEASTAMLRMGDRRGLPTMIHGLDHEDPLVRARAILVLKERTGSTMGYVADGRPEDRAAAVARWHAWLARGGGVMAPAKPEARGVGRE